jgi:hypothetical protein
MKKNSLAIILSMSLILSACSSGAPDCSDSTVKEKVMDMFIVLLKSNLNRMIAEESFKVSDSFKNDTSSEAYLKYQADREEREAIFKMTLEKPNNPLYAYNLYQEIRSDNTIVKSVMDKIDDAISSAKLANIRINKKDDAIKKSECVAYVEHSLGNSAEFQYTAQVNEEGEISVQLK